MKTWTCLLGVLAVVLAAVSCDDDDDDQSTEDDDNDSADDDDDDDNDDNDDDDDNDTTPWGGVTVSEGITSWVDDPPHYAGTASVGFHEPVDYYPWGDAFAHDGDCTYYIRDNMADAPEFLSGGLVTVFDTAAGEIRFTCEMVTWGCEYSTDTDFGDIDDLFAAGQTIHATVAGDDPILAQDLAETAPEPLAVTAPADFDTLEDIPREDFRVAWVPGESDGVTVSLTAAAGYVESSVVCTVPDAQGEVVVPGNLLEMLFTEPFYFYFWVERGNSAFNGGHGAVAMTVKTTRRRTASYVAR
jgi:hypothetical protein